MIERDVEVRGGRVVHVYDTHPGDSSRKVVWWHHGTPNVGDPPRPLLEASDRLGVRWVSADRPGYGGSAPDRDRAVGSVALDVGDVADALGLERFAVMGHSGGGPHALACAALLGERVVATTAVSSPAPYAADGLDFFGGMAPAGVQEHRIAALGRTAVLASDEDEDEDDGDLDIGFTAADEAALGGRWAWFLDVVRPALATGREGAIEDSLASVAPWGFDVATIASPVLLVHGDADRLVPVTHARWLAGRCEAAELRERPGDGHITVLDAGPDVLAWLVSR